MLPAQPFAVRLIGVSKSFVNRGVRTKVLRNVTLQIKERQTTTIVGPSGSGKTTLLRILGGLCSPDAGFVRTTGNLNLYDLGDGGLSCVGNRGIGFVFQDFRLLDHYNALENVMVPTRVAGLPKRHQRALANRALDIVGLQSYKRLRVDQLSGGQQQRVAIARALVMGPELLLADEPTGNLDSEWAADVMGLFERLRRQRGISIVMVTHDRDLASQADHLITLADGRVRQDSYAPE